MACFGKNVEWRKGSNYAKLEAGPFTHDEKHHRFTNSSKVYENMINRNRIKNWTKNDDVCYALTGIIREQTYFGFFRFLNTREISRPLYDNVNYAEHDYVYLGGISTDIFIQYSFYNNPFPPPPPSSTG